MINFLKWTFAIFSAVLTAILCALTGFVDRSRRIPLFMNRFYARIFVPITGIKLKINGADKINFHRNYIVCSNHQGLFDIFTLMAALPLPLRFISKSSYFKIPIIGLGMRGSGHIEITRSDKEKDRETLDKIVNLSRNGASTVMFPEGTRSRDGKVGPFKFGAFYISVNSGIPILPVTIRGSFERMRKGKLLPEPGTVEVNIHPPIDPASHTIDSLMEKTRETITSIF